MNVIEWDWAGATWIGHGVLSPKRREYRIDSVASLRHAALLLGASEQRLCSGTFAECRIACEAHERQALEAEKEGAK